MSDAAASPALQLDPTRIVDLVDLASLRELCVSFERSTGVPVRLTDAKGAPIAVGGDGAFTPSASAPLLYDGRQLGAVELGAATIAKSEVAPTLSHLVTTIELLMFTGHRALVTSQMHLLSTEESFRQLEAKNQSLAQANARLVELDRLKSNFLANVSHELRTPLTSIMGYSELLTSGVAGPLGEEQAEFVGTIQQKSEQLLGLILSLLDLSKLETGHMSMHPVRVTLGSVIGEACSTLKPAATKKGIALDVSVESSIAPIDADPARLRQVFINLIDNAVKFTSTGGRILVEVRRVGGAADADLGHALIAPIREQVEVRVSDSGPGVPPIERERIFDPFYQVDDTSTREHGGAGLGLSIVRRLVEAHGGSVAIESSGPEGTTFLVRLPVSAQAPAELGA